MTPRRGERCRALTAETRPDQLTPAPVLAPHAMVSKPVVGKAGGRVGDDRVARFGGEGAQVSATHGDTRALCAVAVARVDQDRNTLVIDQHPRPAAVTVGSVVARQEGDRLVGPGDHIDASRVTPVNTVVNGRVRVVLVEQVIDALPLAKSVGIVERATGSREVRAWALRVGFGPPHEVTVGRLYGGVAGRLVGRSRSRQGHGTIMTASPPRREVAPRLLRGTYGMTCEPRYRDRVNSCPSGIRRL